MQNAAIILDTLEHVAEREGDPYEKIYARLFETHPDFEELFVMDTDGGVRANMLTSSLTCMIGIAEGEDTARNLLAAAHVHHDGYGLQDKDIDVMFETMRDVFREILSDNWTDETETVGLDAGRAFQNRQGSTRITA